MMILHGVFFFSLKVINFGLSDKEKMNFPLPTPQAYLRHKTYVQDRPPAQALKGEAI